MTALFDKLNLGDRREILVLNAPAAFESELAKLTGVRIARDAAELDRVAFGVGFAVTASERDQACATLAAKADGDATLWIAYPKATSKRYACEFNRDSGWDVMRAAGFDTVRMVALDADWSALRFRRVGRIRRV